MAPAKQGAIFLLPQSVSQVNRIDARVAAGGFAEEPPKRQTAAAVSYGKRLAEETARGHFGVYPSNLGNC